VSESKRIFDAQATSTPGGAADLVRVPNEGSTRDFAMTGAPWQTDGGRRRPLPGLADAEREHILAALRETGWVVGGPKGAAACLGMKRSTLFKKMQKLGISRPE
jgi:transcriptional regulator of acetoin/glycerol metabolism